MANDKGKAPAVSKDAYGKAKRNGSFGGSCNESRNRKRKNRSVLQFFEDAADVDYDDDESDENDESDDSVFDDDDFMEEIFDAQQKANNEVAEAHKLPFIPKEEEMDEEEFDKMMEERYKKRSSEFIGHFEDDYEAKRLVERDYRMSCPKDPPIWKVKCMAGRERQSAFCLMQKFVDLQSLGTKLQIISAFSVDHIKGFIYIEADRQCDINEACKGLSGIYYSRLAPVPKNEVSHLFSAQVKHNGVSEGTWAYVKNGKYKGDLAQVVHVNNVQKRATVKLIPRIDFQALAAKFGGGLTVKKTATAAPRLISPSDLEEFRPLIHIRRDRETGKIFENLDGMMLKDGYLYKKVSIDSLSFWGVVPSEEELLKFQPSESNESTDLEWLSQLYGERKKKQTKTAGKGGDKGEGSSVSSPDNGFELYELICFGRKDFGLIVGMEKDDHYKILKEGSEGPAVVTVERRLLKNGPFEMKFTASDRSMKIISVNDTVRVSEGPSKDRQGIVKKIYRGIIFIYDENGAENGGYFCTKSQLCEKIKVDVCDGKGDKSGASGFEEFPSSPKSPLSPKKSWQAREQNSDFKRGDKDGMFAVGQTLRIRVGPLKGYICRVLAIRYSDVTVKLDSQQKILTVKGEHLAEVRGKSLATSTSDDQGSGSFKPFDPLGTEGCSGDWMSGAGTATEGDRWNSGGASAERSSWPSFVAAGTSLQAESNPDAFGSGDNDANKDEDSSWSRKVTSTQNSSWGLAAAEGKNEDSWNKAAVKNTVSDGGASGLWDKAGASKGDAGGSLQNSQDNWGNAKVSATSNVASALWGKNKDACDKGKDIIGNSTSWGDVAVEKNKMDSWGNSKDGSSGSKSDWSKSATAIKNTTVSWGNASGGSIQQREENTDEGSDWKKDVSGNQDQANGWNKPKTFVADGGSSWNKQGRNCPSDVQDGGSSWGKQDGGSSLGKQEGGSTWGKQEGGSSLGKQDGGSSWGKQDGGSLSKHDGGSSWGKQDGGSSWIKKPDQQIKNDGGPSMGKQDGGSSWGKQDGGSSWGNQDRGSSWGKQDGGSSGGSWGRGRGHGDSRGGRRGDNVQYGRGTFDQGSGWNNEGPGKNWNNNGSSSGNASSWKNVHEGTAKTSDGQGADCWKEPNVSGVDAGSGQTKDWNTDKETAVMADQGTGWNSQKKDTNWGQKSNWNTGSRNEDGNNGSGWGKKSNWNSGSSGAGESNDANVGKNGNWKSGSNDANQESSWGRQGTWNAGSNDGNQESRSGKKNDWNSGSEDQTEPFNNRNNGGRFRGRGGSDRGGFGGRGGSDRGGFFGGRGGSDRGGFGGRGRSDRGGYGGRGRSDRGGFGGRDGSDRGGFGGRGSSDRGGFGGRGRGRRDQSGGWNHNDSGDYKSFDGNEGAKNSGGEWSKSNAGAGSWSQGGDSGQGHSWKSGNGGSSSQAGGWSSQGSGWNNSNTTNEGPSDQGGGWSKGAVSGGWGSQGSGSNSGTGTGNRGSNDPKDEGGGWNKGSGENAQAGGWGNRGSNGDQPKSWNQTNAAAAATTATDGVHSKKDAGEGSSGGSWGKTPESSWGKGSNGSGKGGW